MKKKPLSPTMQEALKAVLRMGRGNSLKKYFFLPRPDDGQFWKAKLSKVGKLTRRVIH